MSCYPPCKRKAIRNFLITRMFLPLNQALSSDDGLRNRPEPQRACSLLLRPADRAIYLLKASLVRAAGGGKGAQRRATVLLQTTATSAREGGQQLRALCWSSLTASLASPCHGIYSTHPCPQGRRSRCRGQVGPGGCAREAPCSCIRSKGEGFLEGSACPACSFFSSG